MAKGFKFHWPSVVAFIAFAPGVFRWVVAIFDWGARLDVILAHIHELGWVGTVISFFLAPPPWSIFPAFVVGFLFLALEVRRTTKSPSAIPDAPAPIALPSQQRPVVSTISGNRLFVPEGVDPDALAALRADRTAIQSEPLVLPYIGKWIRFTGLVRNVYEPHEFGIFEKKRQSMVVVEYGAKPSENNTQAFMQFDEAWFDRLHMLQRGKSITVEGRIDRILAYEIHLEDCGIVN